MKFFRIAALVALAFLCSSCNDSELFYSTCYPIVRIEAGTSVAADPVPEEPEPEEPGEPEPEPEVKLASESVPEPFEVIARINADVLALAPVVPGGSYTLDFTRHNGGVLRVDKAGTAGQTTGTFVKVPGKNNLQMRYDGLDYTCEVISYTDNADGTLRTALRIDLTAHYQALHPDWKITEVRRIEYTSIPYQK